MGLLLGSKLGVSLRGLVRGFALMALGTLGTASAQGGGPVPVPQPAPNDPYYDLQNNIALIKAEAAWDQNITGEGILVAVLDSGLVFDHEDGPLNLLEGRNFVAPSGNDIPVSEPHNLGAPLGGGSIDPYGHGTHITGIIAARRDNERGIAGVAAQADILPVRVLDDENLALVARYENGTAILLRTIIGLRYAVQLAKEQNKKLIINASFGSSARNNYCTEISNLVQDYPNVLFVAAAMNDGTADPRYPAACGNPTETGIPASPNNVIAVGNVVQNNSGQYEKATRSNYGSWLDVSAPGVSVLSTWNGVPNINGRTHRVLESNDNYAYDSGTSMAAALVSGAAALVWSHCPNYSAQQVKDVLRNNVDAVTGSYAGAMGSGVINVEKALQNLEGCITPPKPPTKLPPMAPSNFQLNVN